MVVTFVRALPHGGACGFQTKKIIVLRSEYPTHSCGTCQNLRRCSVVFSHHLVTVCCAILYGGGAAFPIFGCMLLHAVYRLILLHGHVCAKRRKIEYQYAGKKLEGSSKNLDVEHRE